MSAAAAPQAALSDEPSFNRLKSFFIGSTGMEYYAHRDEELRNLIARRMVELKVDDVASYYELLRAPAEGDSELEKLIALATVGETHFFRHQELFTALRDNVLPDAIERRRHERTLRIWSAGCSIGAEPYSVSILLRHDLASLTRGWEISIIGTDINNEFLAQAAHGEYDEWALRDVPEEARSTYFKRCGKQWRIRPQFREGVSFRNHNLAHQAEPSTAADLGEFDLILCRNVMIYFSGETNRTIIRQAHRSLSAGGWLLVGHADFDAELLQLFRPVHLPGVVLYRKEAGGAANGTTGARIVPLPERPAKLSPAPGEGVGLEAAQPREQTIARPKVAVGRRRRAAAVPSRVKAPSGALPNAEIDRIRDLADRGCLVPALQACERLITRNRLDATSHYYHALLLGQLNRNHEAIGALRRAIYLDRGFVEAHQSLGLLLQKVGQPEQAVRCFQNVHQLTAERAGGEADDRRQCAAAIGSCAKAPGTTAEARKP